MNPTSTFWSAWIPWFAGTDPASPHLRSIYRAGIVGLIAASIMSTSGCRSFGKHLGPQAILNDRTPYNRAIDDSWKEQVLLNVVKMRYLEPPFFTDVPQIVGGYSLDRSAGTSVGLAGAATPGVPASDRVLATLGLNAQFSDRPTVSYSPQTDSKFVRNLTAPLPASAVVSLLDAGYGAEAIFPLAVQSINGLRNETASGGNYHPADPEFTLAVGIMNRARLANCFEIRITGDIAKNPTFVAHFQPQIEDPQLADEVFMLKQMLGLDPELNQFPVVYGAAPSRENEIAIHTRPIYLMLRDLTPYVDVPEQHLREGRALDFGVVQRTDSSPLEVRHGCERPEDAYTAVFYRGHWFWIDNGHVLSKRTFIFLRILLALADTRAESAAPTVTIQAN